MTDTSAPAPHDSETDRLWAHPRAVLARYGTQGEVWQDAPSIYSFRQPAIDWYGHALDYLTWSGEEHVLDAGCGRGAYLPHLAKRLGPRGRLVGLDFTRYSLERAREQASGAGLLTGDVQALPFAEGSFDLVISAHMLYHVPDIRAAVTEFRRVLRPEGTLAIIVGSARDQRELDELFLAAGGAFPLQRYSDRFTADNAPDYLEGIFTQVERMEVHPELVIPNAEALVACFVGLRSMAEPSLTPGVSWDSFCDEVRRIATTEIARAGAFRVSEEIAMLICR